MFDDVNDGDQIKLQRLRPPGIPGPIARPIALRFKVALEGVHFEVFVFGELENLGNAVNRIAIPPMIAQAMRNPRIFGADIERGLIAAILREP